MTDHIYETRLSACQAQLEAIGADGIVLTPGPNLTYLSGFHEEPGERHLFLFVSQDHAVFVAPELYASQIRDASWISDIRAWGDSDNPLSLVETVGTDLGVTAGRVLLDDRMWTMFNHDLRRTFPSASFGLASDILDDLRITKDAAELTALRKAGEHADAVSEEVRALGDDAIGQSENELAREIETRLFDRGCVRLSFETIVGSGPNSAKPHYRHGERILQRGDPVILDFGGVVDGYPGDQTRTVVFAGEPPEGFEAVHEVVHDALDAGVAAIEPGVEAHAVDHAARAVIEDAGYGEQILHRTGHGLGLEVHEKPYIVAGNNRSLEPGMVFSVEPGVYFDGEYGVRIEDIVAVTDDGCERLNHSNRTWKPL